MARPISGKERVKTIRQKRKNGDIYIYEKRVIYNPEKGYDDCLGSKLVGKIRNGATEVITVTPRKDAAAKKAATKSEDTLISRQKIGLTDILAFLGRESGIDDDLKAAMPKGSDDLAAQIISIARYWVATEGDTLPHLKYWQMTHPLPCEDLDEDAYHDLFRYIGLTPGIQYKYSKARAVRLSAPCCIAIDSTTFGTYSQRVHEARQGFNKDGDGLDTVKYLSLYAIENRQPLAFTRQPGNIPDVISVKNAIKTLDWLDLEKPTVVMDNGFYSQSNIAQLLLNNLKFLARVEVGSCKWIKNIVLDNLDKLGDYSTICPFDGQINGITLPVKHEFSTTCKYNTENHKAGEKVKFTRRLYLHVFLDHETANDKRATMNLKVKELEKDLREGRWPQLSYSSQRLAARLFNLRKSANGLKVTVKEDCWHELIKLYGVFVLISNNAKFDTFQALTSYRARTTQETFFSKDKGMTDGKRIRVQSSDTLDGRFFCQMVALGYREKLYEKIRLVKAELDVIDDSVAKGEANLRRKLRSWLNNVSAQEILEWFDCVELVKIVRPDSHPAKTIKITTETTARDELFLKMIGMDDYRG